MAKKSKKPIINLPPSKLQFETLTLKEIHEATRKRIKKIKKEFTDGFELIKNYPKSVTFFGSARVLEDSETYKKARELAERISEELGYTVVTGGGPGIMEAANRGAKEKGGNSLGLSIELPREQVVNPYLTDRANFYYFFSRKVCLSFSAESYVFFPGGFGTMDEVFEIIALVQNRKINPVPIILFGKEYWEALDKFIREHLLHNKYISEEDLDLYTITEDMDEIINLIKETPVRNGIR